MGHVTTESLSQDTARYQQALDSNNWKLKVNDYLINTLASDKTAGTMDAKTKMPSLTDDSIIYICVDDLTGIARLDVASNNGWHVNNAQIRILGTKQLEVKANTNSSYGPVRLLGPKGHFHCQFENAQGIRPFIVNTEGLHGNHAILFGKEKGGTFHLSGFNSGGGRVFTGLRAFEPGHDSDVNFINTVNGGVIENFEIHDTESEGIYLGSIKKFHTLFKNVHIHQGMFRNIGSEFFQGQNLGSGCIVENLTAVFTGTAFPSPFQNNQVGAMQIKAGGGNFTVRNIYVENAGQPVLNLFASLPVKDSTGKVIQEGCNPGDVATIENIVAPKIKGNLLYVHQSCASGMTWNLDKLYAGRVTKRIANDTGIAQPYAYLYDVPGAVTDIINIKSITTDGSIPLRGKNGQKYNITEERVEAVEYAKFVKPVECTDVLTFYNVYNEVSQTQFYPVAGQPVKYKEGDICFKNPEHNPREWFNVIRNGTSQNTDIFVPTTWESDYHQTPDSPWYNKVGFKQDEIVPPPVDNCEECEAKVKELEAVNAQLTQQVSSLEAQVGNLQVTISNQNLIIENQTIIIEDQRLVIEDQQLRLQQIAEIATGTKV